MRNEEILREWHPVHNSSERSVSPVTGSSAQETGLAGPTLQVLIRVLIVDDIEAWHTIYAAVLRPYPSWEIVGNAHYGVEAIHMSRELKPDVILLEAELGGMGGFQAAREISYVSPASRILFVGFTPPAQWEETARSTGAWGYVLKRSVVLDLIPALQAVAAGNWFLSQIKS